MKRIFLFILPLFIFQGVMAQNASFLKVKAGVSIPFGSYGNKSAGGAYAITGFAVAMEGAWYVHDKAFGPGLEVGYLTHPLDVGTMADDILANDPFLNSLIIRSEPYRIIHILPSFNYMFPLSPSFDLHTKAGAGLVYAMYPYQLYKQDYYFVGPLWYEITTSRAYNWTALLQAGISYKLVSCLQISADMAYQYMPLSFTFVRGDGTNSYRDYQAHLLNFTLGLSWGF